MSMFKRVLALLAVVALLAAVPVATAAEEAPVVIDPSALFGSEVLHSYATEEKIGNGLAFYVTVNVSGAQITTANEYIPSSAKYTQDGVTYKVLEMGAVLTNQVKTHNGGGNLTIDDANAERTIVRVGAKYLCDVQTDTCSFAARIINIPTEQMGTAISCRPYCILQKVGTTEQIVVYQNGVDVSSFNKELYRAEPERTPVLDLSALGNVDDKIAASATAVYAAVDKDNDYEEGFKVSLSLENVSSNAKTSAGDSVTYIFKSEEGNELGTQTVAVDVLNPGDTKAVEFYAPIGTAAIEAIASNLNYVPVITLPTIGSDIDVSKKKNRIRVSAAEASFNEDGTIHVALSFTNYTSNWITEETDYVQYTYYNAAGTKIKTVTLYIGVIDTKKNKTKTFEFDLPANAAEVKITKSKIVYWTEWA